MNLAPKDWVVMEYACTDNNKDYYDGHLRPGPLDGSLRDGTAIREAGPPGGRLRPDSRPAAAAGGRPDRHARLRLQPGAIGAAEPPH